MTNRPLYKEARQAQKGNKSHAGLWYDRFFGNYEKDWKVSEGDAGKLAWIKTFTDHHVGDSDALKDYAIRQRQLVIDALGGQALQMSSAWNFVTGMGNNHPVENGFAWHPTLGVPYLTGAAVKGMVRGWCETWDGMDETSVKQWFGDTDHVGGIIFFDAIPTAPVKLTADIMTPHYGDWYAKGDQAQKPDDSNTPADWHDPVPIPFLAVAPAQSFQFAFALRVGSSIPSTDVINRLIDALENMGAGAKTAAGYGRFIVPTMKEKFEVLKNDRAAFLCDAEEAMQQLEAENDSKVRGEYIREMEDIMKIHFKRILNNPEKEKRKGEYQYQNPQRSLAVHLNKLLAEINE